MFFVTTMEVIMHKPYKIPISNSLSKIVYLYKFIFEMYPPGDVQSNV